MRILLVDDNPIDLMITQAELENLDQHVICVESGQQAIDIFKTEEIDLIIMDEMMPGLTGRQTTALIREIQTGWVPIIFLSATITPDIILKGIEAGGDDYLGKPVSSTILKAKLQSLGRFAKMRQDLIYINEQMKEKNILLNQLAEHDGLTGLYNRRYLDNFLLMALNKSKRDDETITLIMIDIDWFKLYNDHYGHIEGDKCIIAVAHAMQEVMQRGTDCLGRYGGEEFCVILQNTDVAGSMLVVRKLIECVKKLKIVHEKSEFKHLTISAGLVCITPEKYLQIEDIYKKADQALYVAKKNGRNKFEVYIQKT
ncbi:GGDEF domain-containing response regulator [Marinicellulosiphila megalodicopiae]|uniref:GGDEF domain-containing response regulator n=1 Tax=Marinicellulosiphila megalodicopiae TaxID=2724896 RepID=UPI003BB07811